MAVLQELVNFPKEKVELEGFSATRKLIVDWTDRQTVMDDLIGRGVGVLGEIYPYRITSGARVISVTSEPLPGSATKGSGEVAVYEKALLTVNYSTPRGGNRGERAGGGGSIISESIEPWVENTVVDHRGLAWENPSGGISIPLNPGEAPSKLETGYDYVFTRHRLTSIPSAPSNLIGTSNESPIFTVFSGINFPTQTLLMLPFTVQHTVAAGSNSSVWTITYRFRFKPNGWNVWWHKKFQAYAKILIPDEPNPRQYFQYPPADFTGI